MLQYNIHVNSSEREKMFVFFGSWLKSYVFSGRWITESIWTPSNLLQMLD